MANAYPPIDVLQAALGSAFEVKRMLGEGQTSAVYLAKEPSLDRLVALKVLSRKRTSNDTARRRFEREARAAAALINPNIVQIHRIDKLPDETPYLVMQYVEGRTLEQRLVAEGPLPVAEVRAIMITLASALAAAHAKNILHRDVRPANVMWDDTRSEAMISDFGMAAMMGEEVDIETLTRTGELIGDARYISPEQVLDKEPTALSDVYSLGVLGYELLCGEGPYGAMSSTAALIAHIKGTARDIAELRPDVDPVLADALRRCIKREPSHRPRAADLVRLLERSELGESRRGDTAAAQSLSVDALIERRVPQILAAAAAFDVALIGTVGQLVELDRLPRWVFDLTLPFAASLLAGAAVVAWFHGNDGRQHATRVEWLLLGVIVLIWLSVSAAIVLVE